MIDQRQRHENWQAPTPTALNTDASEEVPLGGGNSLRKRFTPEASTSLCVPSPDDYL
jgi:hypothetical protein